jgi:hypothetical protein
VNKKQLLVAAALTLLASTGAFAQATRTWVSGVGDDVNPCSRTAPCKTFAGAISKTAAGGEINAIDPGGYGTVTITKAITIDGGGTMASILASAVTGINVVAGPSDVVIIRNIEINGAGTTLGTTGIRFGSGAALHVENVHIYNFSGQGIDVNNNSASDFFANNVQIRLCGGGGIYLHPAGGSVIASINRSILDQNGRGLRAEDNTIVSIRDTSATGNTNNGFVGVGTSANVDITLNNVQSSNNGAVGVYAGNLARIKMTNTTVTRNNAGLQSVGGTIISWGNNYVTDNNSSNGPANTNIPPI